MRRINEILEDAHKQGLIAGSQPFGMTIIFVDTDGCVVSCQITHECLFDMGEAIVLDTAQELFRYRNRIRESR